MGASTSASYTYLPLCMHTFTCALLTVADDDDVDNYAPLFNLPLSGRFITISRNALGADDGGKQTRNRHGTSHLTPNIHDRRCA